MTFSRQPLRYNDMLYDVNEKLATRRAGNMSPIVQGLGCRGHAMRNASRYLAAALMLAARISSERAQSQAWPRKPFGIGGA